MYTWPAKRSLLELSTGRTRSSWNDRFEHWERPASESEEQTIERAARMVREALGTNALTTSPFVAVVPQGSYLNNTNIRLESDMDIRADWLETCLVVVDRGISWEAAMSGLQLVPLPKSAAEFHAEHRSRVWLALCQAFGAAVVAPGNKSLKVKAVPNSRAPADVVPAIRCHYAVPSAAHGLLSVIPSHVEGVAIFEPNGARTVNFPVQHHRNGVEKHDRTRRRYKKAVRILKWLRDELIELGELQKGRVPSFLIECLVHAAPDHTFLADEDRFGRVRRLLADLDGQLRNPLLAHCLKEVNGIKPLFGDFLGRPQPWTVKDARSFLRLAWNRMTL